MLSLTFPVLLVNPQGFLCRDYVSYKNIPFGLKNSCFSKHTFFTCGSFSLWEISSGVQSLILEVNFVLVKTHFCCVFLEAAKLHRQQISKNGEPW